MALKSLIESASINDTIAINGFLQLVFTGLFIIWITKKRHLKIFFSAIWIANLFVMAQLVLPITFVSKVSPKEINALIHSSPKGFPIDNLQNSLAENSKDAFSNFNTIGSSYFYNKKIGISRITNSPAFLIQQDKFTQTSKLYTYVSLLPVVYIADSLLQLKDTAILEQPNYCKYAFIDEPIISTGVCNQNNKATIKKLSANSFEIETETTNPAFLVLSQNYYHYWKVTIDGKKGEISKTNMSFMGVAIPAGKYTVKFNFVPSNTIQALWVQLIVLLSLLIAGSLSLYKASKNKV
jgi:hypothetical protein